MTEPRWKQRYRAPSLTLPRWAVDDPERLVYASNLSGSWQVHAWDRAGDRHRQVSDHPTGVVAGTVSPDGSQVVWFEDSKGDEVGRWLRQPFGGGEAAPLPDDVEAAWTAGLALGPKRRLALLHERAGRQRPTIWDPGSGERVDLDVDLPGEVEVADWWPDAGGLLLLHTYLGRSELYRLDLATGAVERLDHPAGSIVRAGVRPDGQVWYRWSSGAATPAVRAVGRDEAVLRPPGPRAPAGVAYQSWTFPNPRGDRVHGFLAVPPGGQGPYPTVLLVHGSPHYHDADGWDPEVQAFVDHGYAVALVNYRGSTGYGKAWQDALEGDPGRPEVEDVAAGRDDLVARGLADPE